MISSKISLVAYPVHLCTRYQDCLQREFHNFSPDKRIRHNVS